MMKWNRVDTSWNFVITSKLALVLFSSRKPWVLYVGPIDSLKSRITIVIPDLLKSTRNNCGVGWIHHAISFNIHEDYISLFMLTIQTKCLKFLVHKLSAVAPKEVFHLTNLVCVL